MKKTLKICILLFISLGILFVGPEVMAATTNITVNKSSITVGDTVTATVKYTAAAWDLKVTADSGLTTSSTTHYADSTTSAENESKSFSVKYTASKAGDFYIYLNGDVTDESASSATDVSKKVKVTVKEKTTTTTQTDTNKDTANNNNTTTKSNNAYLSTLGVTPKEYDFSGFSKTKTSYSVTVPSTVDSLKVSYKTADSKATVKVSGNTGFEVGSNNKIKVVVTAEDGKTTKTYTIKVTKLAEDEEKPGNVIEDDKELYLTSLNIEGLELSPEFAKSTYSYTATLSDASVNEVKVNAVSNKEKAKIDISGNTNLVDGENTINIVLTLDGSSEQTVYQIILTKESSAISSNLSALEDASGSDSDLIGKIKNYIVIAIAVIALIVLAIIVLIVLLKRENKRLKNEENDDTEEYDVYKNDVNEFENDENQEKENFIESLYNQKNNNLYGKTEMDAQDKETLDEINKQTFEIFREKNVEGQSIEYKPNKSDDDRTIDKRRKRRGRYSK